MIERDRVIRVGRKRRVQCLAGRLIIPIPGVNDGQVDPCTRIIGIQQHEFLETQLRIHHVAGRHDRRCLLEPCQDLRRYVGHDDVCRPGNRCACALRWRFDVTDRSRTAARGKHEHGQQSCTDGKFVSKAP